MRSIRSAGLVGMRALARPSAVDAVWCCSRLAKNSRTWQSVGWTVSRTRSKTTKPTGLVSIIGDRVLRPLPTAARRSSIAATAPAARRRNTSMSYADV